MCFFYPGAKYFYVALIEDAVNASVKVYFGGKVALESEYTFAKNIYLGWSFIKVDREILYFYSSSEDDSEEDMNDCVIRKKHK